MRQYFERNGDDKNIMQSDTSLNIIIPKVKVKKVQSKLRNISHRWKNMICKYCKIWTNVRLIISYSVIKIFKF